MKEGPDIAAIASLIGDPARANMLLALMSGEALTASELAQEAGVAAPTASEHLLKLRDGGLLAVEKQGRHRYYRIADASVASAIESLTGLSEMIRPRRTRPGPKEPALRMARVCYDHLAGDMGVRLYDALIAGKVLRPNGQSLDITRKGAERLSNIGLDLSAIAKARRPVCKPCLDWSARRYHLAGGLGAAIFTLICDKGWARRESASRVVTFTKRGIEQFHDAFGVSR